MSPETIYLDSVISEDKVDSGKAVGGSSPSSTSVPLLHPPSLELSQHQRFLKSVGLIHDNLFFALVIYNLLLACHLNLVLMYLPDCQRRLPIIWIVILVVVANFTLADLLLRNGLRNLKW